MERNKAMDKIEKCINLSKSSVPAEAAAALRQAQKLMQIHGITEAELGMVGYAHEKVSVPIQANKKLPIALSNLISLIARSFGVRPVIGSEVRVSDVSYTVTYFGPKDRVQLSCYAHVVVYRALEAAWRQHLADHPYLKGERGARAGFQLGWLDAVESTVEAFVVTDDEKIGTDLVVKETFPTLVKIKTNDIKVDVESLNAGAEAADGFSLHRPVVSERLKIGNS